MIDNNQRGVFYEGLCKMSTPYIKDIENAESVNMQLPLYTFKENRRIKYTYYEVDKDLLHEWKEVIQK